MQLINLGCGNVRPGAPWINMDNLLTQHAKGTPERAQIEGEPNYMEADLRKRLPIADNIADGILLSHLLEHLDAQEGLRLLIDAKRILKPGGCLMISVPDAAYFRKVMPEDRNENWERLFGQADPKNPIPTFHEAALWFEEHKAILTEDAVWCYLARAGFAPENVHRMSPLWVPEKYREPEFWQSKGMNAEANIQIVEQLNRLEFSLLMHATKS